MGATDPLSDLEQGHYEVELINLQLVGGNGSTHYTGQGMLTWTADTGLNIQALTNGGEQVVAGFLKRAPPPGKLLRPEDYLRLDARTQSGDQVTVKRLLTGNSRCHVDSPNVVWSWPSHDICSPVSICGPALRAGKPAIGLLMQPVSLPLWPRGSRIDRKEHP